MRARDSQTGPFVKEKRGIEVNFDEMVQAVEKSRVRDGRPSIFEFKDYKDFLKTVGLPHGKYSHSSQTLQKWAQRLGYRSPSSLTMILNGQRFPSRDMIKSLARDLDLSQKELEYFELLIDLAKAKSKDKNTEKISSRLNQLSGNRNTHQVSLDQFRYISEWYFAAIKQLISAPNFVEDAEWIRTKLRKKLTPGQVRYAIQVMLDLGVIERDEQGKLIVSQKPWRTPKEDISSAAIRKHHAGMINLSMDAIEEQKVSDRQLSCLTFRFNPEKMPEAKEFLLKMLEEFDQRFFDGNSDEVYQLNMQLFGLTRKALENEKIYQ